MPADFAEAPGTARDTSIAWGPKAACPIFRPVASQSLDYAGFAEKCLRQTHMGDVSDEPGRH